MNELCLERDSLTLRSTRRMAIERAIVALRNVWTGETPKLSPTGDAHRHIVISERINLRKDDTV